MKKLSKEKRQQLILTGLIAAAAVFGLWHGLIKAQQEKISLIEKSCKEAEAKLQRVKETVARAKQIESSLSESGAVLAEYEQTMASGDLYSWAVTSIREFKVPYKVEIPQFSQINGPKDSSLLPGFPYKEASLTIAGRGKFHDIGIFVADFENKNPFTRICNLALEPMPAGEGNDGENLTFRMDVVSLVKPTM